MIPQAVATASSYRQPGTPEHPAPGEPARAGATLTSFVLALQAANQSARFSLDPIDHALPVRPREAAPRQATAPAEPVATAAPSAEAAPTSADETTATSPKNGELALADRSTPETDTGSDGRDAAADAQDTGAEVAGAAIVAVSSIPFLPQQPVAMVPPAMVAEAVASVSAPIDSAVPGGPVVPTAVRSSGAAPAATAAAANAPAAATAAPNPDALAPSAQPSPAVGPAAAGAPAADGATRLPGGDAVAVVRVDQGPVVSRPASSLVGGLVGACAAPATTTPQSATASDPTAAVAGGRTTAVQDGAVAAAAPAQLAAIANTTTMASAVEIDRPGASQVQAAAAASADGRTGGDAGQAGENPSSMPFADLRGAARPARGERPAANAPAAAEATTHVALQLAKAAKSGIRHIEIALQPAALGKVDVRLDFGRDGTVNATFVADTHEALHTLRADAHNLERALADAGVKTGSGGLDFCMRDPGGQSRGGASGTPFAAAPQRAASDDAIGAEMSARTPSAARRVAEGRIDIHA